MANINLTTFEEKETKQERFTEGALLGIFGILVLVLAIWGGLVLYKKYYLEKGIVQTQEKNREYVEKMKSDESKKTIDFQRRLDISGGLVSKGRNIQSDLGQLEMLIIPNVYLISYSYDDTGSKIVLNCVADNFNTVAKQILSFKNSSSFSSVIAGKTQVDSQSNKISFPVELKIK